MSYSELMAKKSADLLEYADDLANDIYPAGSTPLVEETAADLLKMALLRLPIYRRNKSGA